MDYRQIRKDFTEDLNKLIVKFYDEHPDLFIEGIHIEHIQTTGRIEYRGVNVDIQVQYN